jgi:hypothetical protein
VNTSVIHHGHLLIGLLLGTPLIPALMAADYYMAPDGKDTQNGTIVQPFESIQRAQQAAQPGDTIHIRGGTYRIREEQIARKTGIWSYVFEMNKSGKPGAPIRYWAYQNEKPVFDFSDVKPEGTRIHAFQVSGSWLHFKGFEVVGVQVTMKTHTQSECFHNLGSNNIYERLSMHDGQAIGFYLVNGSNNLVLNCDAYRNHDYTSENGIGGNTDGFGCHPRKGATGNVFRGCRAWFNSDDGYDCISACESVTFDRCWAFYNGYTLDFKRLCDGNGFKVGGWARTPTHRLPSPMPRHTTRFCLAVRNKASGFYANHHLEGNDWFNNTAYRNGNNFNMLERTNNVNGVDFDMKVPGFRQKMRNNLGYKGGREVTHLDEARGDVANNSFNLDIRITDADFLSLDEAQLILPRKADGSLPDMTFLHLAPASACIDKGEDIGFPFAGSHPDLGCFEAAPGQAALHSKD